MPTDSTAPRLKLARTLAISLVVLVLGFVGWSIIAAVQQETRGGGQARATNGPPQRIVPASARAIDLALALVGPNRIAGLPEQAIEYSTLREREAEILSIPRFNAYVAEPVLELLPDLVLADPWQSADTHARLREAGVKVLVLPEASNWIETKEVIRLLGAEVKESAQAEAVIRDGDARVALLRAASGARHGLRALCYSNFGAQGYTAGSGTTLHEMIVLAGLENAVALAGRAGHETMTFEDLLELDPDVIIVSRPLNAPEAHTGDRGGASEQLLLSEPSLAQLRAVVERRIVSLPAGLFASASQNIVLGAETLAHEVDQLLARLAAEAVR
jgi:iron complex transport system substrate-binding protein